MKKIILLIGLSLITSGISAQKISLDRIENDGKHQIMTKTKEFSIDGAEYSFGIKIYESSYVKDWLLLISSYHYIPSSSEVLLKLGNDEILYIPVNNVNIGKVTMPGYGYTIGYVTTMSSSQEVDYYYSVYELDEVIMDKIDTHGIKKIRISNGVKYRDKTFINNSLGRFLSKCRKNIQRRLDAPIKRKGLFEDF